MTTIEKRAERCALLLRYPLATNSGAYFSLAKYGDKEILETLDTKPDVPLGFIAAQGIGSQCRWMIVRGLLVILFNDGSTVYKVPPEDFRYSSNDPYRAAFGFSNASTDAIVLNTRTGTYVIRVRGGQIEEETLGLNAFCYAGYFDEGLADVFWLVGQTPRTRAGPEYARGRPLLIEVSGDKFVAKIFQASGMEKVESIVSAAKLDHRILLLCAEGPNECFPIEDDLPLEEVPCILDHFRFYVVDAGSTKVLSKIELMRFLSMAGPQGDPRWFFEEVNFKSGTSGVVSCRLRSLMESGHCELEPLVLDPFASSYDVGIIRYDEQLGFTSLACENPRPGMHWFVWSGDGQHWERQPVGK